MPAIKVFDLEVIAREKLSQEAYDYYDSAMALAGTPTGFDITRDLVWYPLARLVPVFV
jgi:hypothetical protein